MTYEQARRACRNPGAIVRGENWLVINSVTGEPLETAKTEERAALAALWVNQHEKRGGRAEVYVVRPVQTPGQEVNGNG